ncbi:hypothetical protein ETAA8_27000 [Anatilimnocola aggregata]|uniref:Uncharacterized protein n=1 Tax=Anatilimnocola aggregata TaxID=2528021 RepID=A0A517YBW6_9BACT|nr:hypothetical protein [Anatilimnocola aggregata]QDU27612.1 hypothetical protein ETAA8_27000 [Anatilimnocola aggregata]
MNVLTSLILSLAALGGDDSSQHPAGAAAQDAAHDANLPHAVQVYRCDFAQEDDRNYDGWPDGWVRRRGKEFPAFLKIGIQPEATGAKVAADSERYLQMELSGGSAGVMTPSCALGARGSFLLECQVRTKQLKHDHVFATLTFYDDHGQPLESYESNHVVDAPRWQTLRVGPVLPKSEAATHARVTLAVTPRGDQEDLNGVVHWGSLRMLRLPRIALRASGDLQVYDSLTAPEVSCEISGLVCARPELQFELLDHTERVIATEMRPLVLEEKRTLLKHSKAHSEPEHAAPQAGITGSAKWKPPIPDYGFYRVRVSMQQADQPTAAAIANSQANDATMLHRSVTLAVLRPLPRVAGGEFGWSLPGGEDPLPLNALASLLSQSGLGWAKYPVWFSEQEQAQADRLAWFAERLSIHGIEMVGVLDQPPSPLREMFRDKGRLPAASVFQEPQLWQPAVDPVMTRLSLKVRWWQLGDDRDTSYVDFPILEERVQGIKTHLERFGQQVHLGFGWRWLREMPNSKGTPPWEFLSYSADPELTADELAAYLPRKVIPAAPGTAAKLKAKLPTTPVSVNAHALPTIPPTAPSPSAMLPRAWVVLTPLPRSQYSTATRTLDLVQRMLAARQHGASAVFVPQPFSEEQGLMNADGSPGELFVPWRTTATLLGGTQYLGALQLPGGSVNHVFSRDGQTVMVIWNDVPGKESFYLGDEVRQLDLWGREIKPEFKLTDEQGEDRPESIIQVGPEPTFVTGLDEGLTRWQIRAKFVTTHLESVFGRQQPVTLRLENAFAQGVSGSATLHAPKAWNISPQPLQFRMSEGETAQPDWLVSLQPDAASGLQRVRIDFELTAERNYRFSVYRTLQLGLDDVTVEMRTRVREDGLLLVEQHVTNLTGKPISFQCLLFPPGRRRETKQMLHLPAGRHTVTFLIPQGESLLGQTLWLRAEEIGGPRVLNSTVVVER